MRLRKTAIIKTERDILWQKLQYVSSLQYVASPILIFKAAEESPLSGKWLTGILYDFHLFLFGIIPLGKHSIKLVDINKKEWKIQSDEHGNMVKCWRHTIKIDEKNNGFIRYTDEVEINAGIITLFVWLFSLLFYSYRQYRWRKILDN